MCDRFYRFSECGREVVYDREGATALCVNDTEAHLLTWLQQGHSCEESCSNLRKRGLTSADIAAAAEHLEREGFLTPHRIPYQDIPPMYTVTLNVTQECNLRCKYCFVEKHSSSVMSEPVAKKAVDFVLQFEDVKRVAVAFYGGEPLLVFPVVKAAIEYASKEAEKRGLPEVKYQITTNGTLLTDEVITFLKDYPIDVMVSMDGPASTHDSMRVTRYGEKTHAVVLQNLLKLLNTEGKHRVSVSGVITNQGRLKDIYEYLSQFPLWDVKLSYVRYLDESEAKKYALSDHQKVIYLSDMKWLAQQCADSILQGVRPPFYNFENIILQLWRHVKRGYFCLAGLKQFGISPEGEIYPCGPSANLHEFALGTLKDGLNTSLVDRWVTHTSFEKDECNQCWAQYLCMGGCPLQLVKTPESECEINRYATQLAIAVYAAVKEENEMMLASLINEEFLSEVRDIMRRMK